MVSKIAFILLIFSLSAFGQTECDKYETGYIPIDLNDALDYLDCKWNDEDKNNFKNQDENKAIGSIHLGTGMAIRNSWGLWKGNTEIAKYFQDLGIYHPDDMSGIILTSLHRRLNNKDIALQAQINYYKKYWEEAEKREEESKRKEFAEFQVGDRVEFSYDFDFISKEQEDKWMNDKCFAKGIIKELDSTDLKLKVKLIESCDKKGVIIYKGDIYEEVDGKWTLKEKDKVEIMKKGEAKWTSYELWETVEY